MKYTYTYDENRKHATKVTVTNTAGGAQKYAKSISYDGYDRTIKEDYGASAIGTEVNYPDGNNSPEERVETLKHIMNGTLDTTSYTYDGLNRLTQKEMEASVGIRIYRQKYAYLTGKSGTNETTGLVKSEELHEGFSTSADEKYEYTYDANGNVTEIKNLLDTGKNVSYEYDSLNRLTKETNLAIGNEWRYTYDNGGNITKKEEYNPATGALRSSWNYGYGDTYWKDQLTSWGSYGTNSFAYDDSGNPTKYKGKTLEWEGKRLARYNESDMKYTDLSYDGNGLLAGYFYSNTYSIWGGATFTTTMTREITRDGDRILSEKVTEYNPETNSTTVKNIMYAYDEKGVSGMTVGGKKYYFVRNIFGDVTAIYNTSRVKCAEYAYDAWGTMYITLDTEGVGSLNPFRYRGYYMVSCIGLYYLTTRFYDYMTGRFLNADVPSICFDDGLKVPEGCNLYSYCRNNPIMNVDPSGHVAISLLLIGFFVGAAVGFGGSVVSQGITNGWDNINWWQAGFDALIGGITGLIGGSGIGTIGSMISGGVLGFAGSVGGDLISNGGDFGKVNWGKAIVMGVVGIGLGAWSGRGVGNVKGMTETINSGKSWGAKTFLNFSASVADKGASIGARQTAALFMENAILGFKIQSFTKVFSGIAISLGINGILSNYWR
ncbi:MAG: RHS repeat-associated core domain-containing protein [Christensenellales bacterium]